MAAVGRDGSGSVEPARLRTEDPARLAAFRPEAEQGALVHFGCRLTAGFGDDEKAAIRRPRGRARSLERVQFLFRPA